MFRPTDLFDLSQTAHTGLFEGIENAWELLAKIEGYVTSAVRPFLKNRRDAIALIGEHVFIGEGTIVEDGAMIKGPAIIGRNCQIRHNAYIRENVLVGDNCVIGNSSEIKNALLFNGASAPHFNYVGDSVLGYKAHLGAGVKLSNFKATPGNVFVVVGKRKLDTGLRKFGALLGDRADIGCNAVLNPGTIVGRETIVYPNTNCRGVIPAHRIVKNRASQEIVERKA
jgi:NDP-sugar pyrophosphorylase family protein